MRVGAVKVGVLRAEAPRRCEMMRKKRRPRGDGIAVGWKCWTPAVGEGGRREEEGGREEGGIGKWDETYAREKERWKEETKKGRGVSGEIFSLIFNFLFPSVFASGGLS